MVDINHMRTERQTKTMKKTIYDALIGYNAGGAAVLLCYTFNYGDGFKGAVGATLELVSQEQYDEATTAEALEEYAEELWRADAAQPNGTTLGLSDWAEMARDELIESLFDDSYGYLVPEGEHVTTHYISGGRIWDAFRELPKYLLYYDTYQARTEACVDHLYAHGWTTYDGTFYGIGE